MAYSSLNKNALNKGIKLSFEGQTGVSQDERGCVDGE